MVAHTRLPRFRWQPYRFKGESRPCSLCGSKHATTVGTRDRWLQKLRNVMCRDCGLVRLDPMPTREDVDRYYAEVYRRHYQGSTDPRARTTMRAMRSAGRRVDHLVTMTAPGARILDVGASSGEFVHLARNAGYAADGLEPNLGFTDFAQRTYGLSLLRGGLDEVDIAPACYDAITLFHVLEHLRDPVPALTRMHGWLKPGGLLHVAVPDIASVERMPIGKWHFGHKHGYSRETLEMLGRKTGFEVTDASRHAHAPDLVFVRRDGPLADWMIYPDHAGRLGKLLTGHTVVRHLASLTAYRRFVRRCARFTSELAALPRSRWSSEA